jgi:hypothetical protein
MTTLKIWVVDHRGVDSTSPNALAQERNRIDRENNDFPQRPGPIIDVWNPRLRGMYNERYYADYNGFSGPWYAAKAGGWEYIPDLIGFFGYRKYLWMPQWFPLTPAPHCVHAPGWVHVSKRDFDEYRGWLSEWKGSQIKELLRHYDILQAAPYIYADGNSVDDFVKHCGSPTSGQALVDVLKKHKLYDPTWRHNYPNFLMVTHWEVYDWMMREIDPIMRELDEYHGEDSNDVNYTERPNLYYLERIYPLWLKASCLKFLEVPMLHCRAVGPQAPGW